MLLHQHVWTNNTKTALIDQLCLNQFHMLHSNMKREQTYSKYLHYTEYHTGTIRHYAD